MRERFLSCLPSSSQLVIQTIPSDGGLFPLPIALDALYLAQVSLQLGIKLDSGHKINNILPKLKHKFNCLQQQTNCCTEIGLVYKKEHGSIV